MNKGIRKAGLTNAALRRKRVAGLRESELRLLDAHSAMLWKVGLDGRFVPNTAWLRFCGLTKLGQQPASWSDAVHPDDRNRCLQAFLKAFESRTEVAVHHRLRRADGQYRTVLSSGAPWYEPAAGFAGFVGSVVDITEQAEPVRSMQKSEQLYRATVSSLQEGVVVFDADDQVIAMNGSAAHLLGLRRPVVGHGFFCAFRRLHLVDGEGQDFADAARGLADLLHAHRSQQMGPIGCVGPDGRTHWLMIRMEPLRSPASGELIGAVASQVDVTLLKDEVQAVRRRAGTDPLTGLANRAELYRRLREIQRRARRTGEQVAVAFCDLDDFKSVNDKYGHAAGDDLLQIVARRVRSSVRAGDTVARLGGDELVLVLDPVSGPEGALAAAEQVCRAVGMPVSDVGVDPASGTGQMPTLSHSPIPSTIVLGASIGVTMLDLREDPHECLERADAAMYQAKHRGGGQVAFSEKSCDQVITVSDILTLP